MHRDSRVRMRALNKKDWSAWKVLRLEALKNALEAFGSSYEEESQWPDERFKDVFAKNHIFGFFIDGQLAGIAGFYVMNQPKTKHRGVIWGVYVQPECRGMNMANRLLTFLIGHAKSYVSQLHLTCVTTNQAAIKLYEKLGFTIIGTEPHSLKIGEDFFDEYNMVLQWTKKEAVDAINSQTPKEVTLHYRDFEIAYTVHPVEDSGYYSGNGGIFLHSAAQDALYIPVCPPISCCSEEDFREIYESRAKLAIDSWYLEKEVKTLLAEEEMMSDAKKHGMLSHSSAQHDEKKYH